MSTDPQLGSLLVGRYRLREVLGRGAHGVVFLADDTARGGAAVALKWIGGLVGGEPEASAESILRWFRHPGWAEILDVGRSGEHDWFQALRYVPGKDLSHINGSLPEDEVWRFLTQMARVLRAVHARGLIHYDVTPGNVICEQRPDGRHYILTDGGLAHVGPVRGVARGTPAYMAPEVTEDGGHDHRVDLYSLGLLAFRLATGRDAFEGKGSQILVRRRREPAPKVRQLVPELTEGLELVIAGLLATRPDDRPADAEALLREIRRTHDEQLPDLTVEETLAASLGGPLVGRDSELARFQRTLEDVTRLLPVRPGAPVQGPCTALPDPVVFLRGTAGTGSTRTLAELRSRAREVDLPVVLLGDPHAPVESLNRLEALADSLESLGRAPGDEGAPPTPRRRRTTAPAQERARWMERLVPLAEAAAARTPFLLAVESYAAWPTETRDVIDVLVRHIASRHVHGGKGARPPILVAVDVGDGSPESLRVPDAAEPEQHEWTLPALTAGQLADLLVSKFPQLRIDPRDAAAVHEKAEGLPGVATNLLGEAAERRDIALESGWLVWKLDDLSAYRTTRTLPAPLAHTLAQVPEATRRWLRWMARLDAPLTPALFQRLGALAEADEAPNADLLTHFRTGSREQIRLAHEGLKDELTDATHNDEDRTALLAFLDEAARKAPLSPALRVACARLLGEDDQRKAALQTLLGIERDAAPALRIAAVELGIDLLPPMPEALPLIERLACVLPQGNTAASVGERLLQIVGPNQFGATSYVHLSEVFATSNRPQLAYEMGDPSVRGGEATQLVLAFAVRSVECDSAGHRRLARVALRTSRYWRLRCDGLDSARRQVLLWAWGEHLRKQGRIELARMCLAGAVRERPEREQRTATARAWLGLGIVNAIQGDGSLATRAWRRASRLYDLEGATRDALAARYNGARLSLLSGALREGSIAARACAATASRHGLRRVLARSLALLAQCLDADARGAQASTMLARAVVAARGHLPPARTAQLEASSLVLSLATEDSERSSAPRADLLDLARASGANHASRWFGHQALLELALLAGHGQRINRHANALQRRAGSTLHESGVLLSEFATIVRGLSEGSTEDSQVLKLYGRRAESEIRDLIRTALLFRDSSVDEQQLARTLRRMRSGAGRRRFIAITLNRVKLHDRNSLAVLRRTCEQSGEVLLLSRIHAIEALSVLAQDKTQGARLASRAIAGVTRSFQSLPVLRERLLPPEFNALAQALTPSVGTQFSGRDVLTQLNALAHTALTAAPARGGDNRRAQALRNALELGARLRADEPLDRLLEDLTQHAASLTGAERACVVHVDENGELVLEVSSDATARGDGPQFSHSVINRVLRYRRPLLWTDVFEDEELFGQQSVEALRLNSVMCVPMLLGDDLYGVLYADNTARAAAFDDTDLDVLCLFAQLAANALHSQTMISRLRRSKEEIAELQGRMISGERLRVIGELSSGVAHEFNNLLTSILARVQLINLEAQSASLKPDLDMIEKACLDAAEVVRRLQSFGKAQQQQDFERLDLGDIARDAVEFLRPLWADKTGVKRRKVAVSVVSAPHVSVMGNPTELREIVTNLVKNALEAMPEQGEIRVEIAETGGHVALAVRDNGQGMPPDVMRQAFDPFFTTKGERGTGLGLCLVRQIVERHGGQMELHSVAGQGTTVQMRFPSGEAGAQVSLMPAAPPVEEVPALRVLVVDDDEDVRTPLCRYLEKQGYEVYAAASGNEGLERARDEQPDVIISDVRMPGMDGLQLCQALNESLPEAPVVLMSGWASGVDASRAEAVGAAALLAKPFAMQQVAEILADYAAKDRAD